MAKKYVQQFELGSGAFGRAVVVRNTDIHKDLVAKIIQVKNLSEVELDRCVTEVLVLKACNHRNIIQYYEAFVEQECLHIVMEFARGGDLNHKIQAQTRLGKFFTCEEIIQWFIQIVLALEYIHSKGILHRDLKPQNVFLTENSTIKLGDFGIAKVLTHGDDLASTRIGTPFYISPEICAGKQYNSSNDMWAAGCLLFELTLLRVPFNAASLSALTRNIIQCQFDQIPRYNSSSDMWTAGCLLFELTLLRVPFNAASLSALNRNIIQCQFDQIPRYNSSSDMWAAGCLLFELTLLRVPFNAASLSALTRNIIQCQFDQIPRYNSSSDMWSAGCLLFELTLLRVPFNAASLSALTRNIIQCQFDQIPRSFGVVIPKFISQLIVFEPEKRLTATDILNCPEVSEIVDHHRRLNPDEKKVRRSSSVRSLGGREVRKSVEAVNKPAITQKGAEIDQNDVENAAEKECKTVEATDRNKDVAKENENVAQKDSNTSKTKSGNPSLDRKVERRGVREDTSKQASSGQSRGAMSCRTQSASKVRPRTYSLKDSVVRKLSAASPKLAETIRKQRLSVGEDTCIKTSRRCSSIDITDDNDDVFNNTTTDKSDGAKRRKVSLDKDSCMSSLDQFSGKRQRKSVNAVLTPARRDESNVTSQRKGSITYTVLKPQVVKGTKCEDENNNNNSASSLDDVNSTLLLAVSVLKTNPALARRILVDKITYSIGQQRCQELIKIVKHRVSTDGQTYHDIRSSLGQGEEWVISLISMLLCIP